MVFEHTERAGPYGLSTRSHKGHINGQQCEGFLRQNLPLPTPRLMPHISQGQGQQSEAPNGVSPVWFATDASGWLPRNRMRSWRTSGSVGRAPGNRCLYPESDGEQPPLLRRCGCSPRLKRSVRRYQTQCPFLLSPFYGEYHS